MKGPGGLAAGAALTALVLAGFLLASVPVAIGYGSVSLGFGKVWAILLHELGVAVLPDPGWSRADRNIVWELRLPRVLLGAAAGAGLAAVGAVLQVVTRNPLADPYLFGVSAGASFGAVLVILYGAAWAGPWSLPLAAFAGAVLSFVIVFGAARSRTGRPTSEHLVLTGVAVAFILHAMTNFLILGAQERGAEAALFWMLGGLGGARWSTLPAPLAVTLIGTAWLWWRAASLNALAFGDDTARSVGIDPARLRVETLLVSALVTGAIVSVSGGIGFVGLILPHTVRRLVGGDLRRLVPLSALLGALFLVWIDVVARRAFAPREVPIGIVTAVIGGFFFLGLMRRRAERSA